MYNHQRNIRHQTGNPLVMVEYARMDQEYDERTRCHRNISGVHNYALDAWPVLAPDHTYPPLSGQLDIGAQRS